MEGLLTLTRLLLGAVYLINGINWFFKLITPYPSMSDFVDFMPPPDIVGAMVENGILFHMAKGVEVVTGLALLTNRMVPLALVVAMTVTVPVCIVDVFKPEFRLRSFLMGSGSLTMNTTLLLAYFQHYRPMMAWRGRLQADPSQCDRAVFRDADRGGVAQAVAVIARPLMWPLACISTLYGMVLVAWLLVMVGQYAMDPQPLSALHDLASRP